MKSMIIREDRGYDKPVRFHNFTCPCCRWKLIDVEIPPELNTIPEFYSAANARDMGWWLTDDPRVCDTTKYSAVWVCPECADEFD